VGATIDPAPAVIVRNRAEIDAALAPGLPVTLLSPPGFALYAGAPWWAALLEQAGFTKFSLLDCADAPGRSLEALRLGLPGVVLTAEPPVFARVAAIAAEYGGVVLDRPPPALDMAVRGSEALLGDWLRGDGRNNLG